MVKKLISIIWLVLILMSCTTTPVADTLSPEEIELIKESARATADFIISLTLEAEALATSTPPVTVVAPDFLLDKTCVAPCFLGITPDKTPMKDVNNVLREYLEHPSCTAPPGETTKCSLGKYGYMFISSDLDTGLVDGFEYIPDPPTHLAPIIMNYGEPDFLYARRTEEDITHSYITLFYNELHTIIELEVRGRLLETSEVSQISFFNRKEFNEYVEIDSYYPQLSWHGYGDYP